MVPMANFKMNSRNKKDNGVNFNQLLDRVIVLMVFHGNHRVIVAKTNELIMICKEKDHRPWVIPVGFPLVDTQGHHLTIFLDCLISVHNDGQSKTVVINDLFN